MGVLFGLGLPAFQQISGFDPVGITSLFLDQIIFYPLIGYFLDSRVIPWIVESRNRKWISFSLMAGLLLILSVAYSLNRQSLVTAGTLAYASWFLYLWFLEYIFWQGYFLPGSGRIVCLVRCSLSWGAVYSVLI